MGQMRQMRQMLVGCGEIGGGKCLIADPKPRDWLLGASYRVLVGYLEGPYRAPTGFGQGFWGTSRVLPGYLQG